MKTTLFVATLSIASISLFLAEQNLPAVLLIICSIIVLNVHSSRCDSVNAFDKAVFITGCDSGFGHQLCKRLDEHGFLIFAGCLLPDGEGAQQLKDECSDKLHVVPLDVTNDQQVQEAVTYVKENLGKHILWAIVNNAGVGLYAEIELCSLNQFQRILDVNVIGVARVTKALLPMVRNANGRVINVAGVGARFTKPAFAACSMSKRACTAFTDTLRVEMKKFNVKVILIEPDFYKTPMPDSAFMQERSRKSWSETPIEVKNAYGYEYFDAFLQNLDVEMQRANQDTNKVVDSMEHAVTSVNPRKRYVPCDSTLSAKLFTYLPSSISDYLSQDYTPKCRPKQSSAFEDDEFGIGYRVSSSSNIHVSSTSTNNDKKL